MNAKEERDRYFYEMGRAGATFTEAADIYRAAQSYQRLSVCMCNRELTPREEAKRERVSSFLDHTPERLGARWSVELQGDPRGACVKLHVDGRTVTP